MKPVTLLWTGGSSFEWFLNTVFTVLILLLCMPAVVQVWSDKLQSPQNPFRGDQRSSLSPIARVCEATQTELRSRQEKPDILLKEMCKNVK